MTTSLAQLVSGMRRYADRHPWYVTDPWACPSGYCRRLVVDGHTFNVHFSLTISDWQATPEHVLVLAESGKERPDKAAVETMISLFFDPSAGPVCRADRRLVISARVHIYTQAAPRAAFRNSRRAKC